MTKLIAAAALFVLTGCNTVGGVGKDLEILGGVIAGTADGVQNASAPARSAPAPDSATPTDCQPNQDDPVLASCPSEPLGKDMKAVGDALLGSVEKTN